MILLFEQSKNGKQSVAKLVKEFPNTGPQRHANASCVKHEALHNLRSLQAP